MKYTIQGLEEYIRQGEPQQRERGEAWKVAIGLQQVDGLQTSEYLLDTACKHIEGDITIEEVKVLIDSYYKSADGRKLVENNRTEEADKVSTRITEILEEKTFSFTPAQLISIHRRLFEGIYKFAGRIRDYNITKNEWVLGGKSVYYASADTISDTLDYDMGQEREFSYDGMNVDDAIRHLARFCANLWQTHAFCEGNTRTTAVFMIKYLRTLGFNVVNDVFAENSWYFRNALVRANYSDLTKGITETTMYLERFFRSMLLGEQHDLRNRIMHVDWEKTDEATVQSAKIEFQSVNTIDELPSKCKNCTLEEIAVLRIVQKKPTATQKEIAVEIGKSERTVKTITINLQEKGILQRLNGKRNGRWELNYTRS
ncbi:MAG: Fic family protein [Bacteroidales bacterium]|nr:Fic family protein [Bacteroidales bacterium]